MTTTLSDLHEDMMALAAIDDARLNRIEADVKHTRLMVDALCRAIGGPARKALDQLEAKEAGDG